MRRKRFINTGFLNLPICPVYGVIGVAYCIFLPELKHRIFFLFLGGAVVAFLVIVITGVILEKVFNRKWWDYSQARFQFQGYLNYLHLLFFGAAAVASIWFINPLILDLSGASGPDRCGLLCGYGYADAPFGSPGGIF